MKIYSMTATFGKLEHETLTFQEGLNIIEAPNEWGKSTWCAFLVNMLYGIDTRVRTTKDALADKERYAPWSGSPMSGSIDLNWNGRDITIQRSTKGRLIFGEFKAFETESGIEVPELTATNCGQMLTGVERSVFLRAGFLKLSDLPVTQDDSFRRRLNDLVTTGDESGDADKLAQTLKDLKNRCRYNRSGLLPQAENEREQLRTQLNDLHSLRSRAETIQAGQAQLASQLHQLENHRDALRYEASQDSNRRIADAKAAREEAANALAEQEARCANLTVREELLSHLRQAQTLQDRLAAIALAPQPTAPVAPAVPERYAGQASAAAKAAQDAQTAQALQGQLREPGILWFLLAIVCGVAGGVLLMLKPLFGAIGIGLAMALLILAIALNSGRNRKNRKLRQALDALTAQYGGLSVDAWVTDGAQFDQSVALYQAALGELDSKTAQSLAQKQALDAEIAALTGGDDLSRCKAQWEADLAAWNALEEVRRASQQAEAYAVAIEAMAMPVPPAKEPDELTYDQEETQALLTEGYLRQQKLQLELGQAMGQAEALGQESVLKERLDMLNRRIARLEDTYYALELAQDALHSASTELQRRFAPRISKRAQELFGKLTGGRYQKISMTSDLSLNAAAENEDTLRSAQWRSDGTVDQLYLALRLAVAEELTPQTPLILDDALVRFDDARLKAALRLLQEAAQSKQVILFSCQGREKQLL